MHICVKALLITIFVLAISISLFVRYYPSIRLEKIKLQDEIGNDNIAVILTAYIGDRADKKVMYTKSIKKWLSQTPLNIYFVDSSGVGIDIKHPRFKSFVFDQGKKYQKNLKSYHEIISIKKIFEEFRSELEKYDMIFKITGRYFTKDLMYVKIPKDAEILVQSSTFTFGQNSEIFGMIRK